MTDYADFLARKAQLANQGGFEPTHLPDYLFPFQRLLVDWAIRQGRAARRPERPARRKRTMSAGWRIAWSQSGGGPESCAERSR